jgi:hypothetical protein
MHVVVLDRACKPTPPFSGKKANSPGSSTIKSVLAASRDIVMKLVLSIFLRYTNVRTACPAAVRSEENDSLVLIDIDFLDGAENGSPTFKLSNTDSANGDPKSLVLPVSENFGVIVAMFIYLISC